jgi:hypothetical protein
MPRRMILLSMTTSPPELILSAGGVAGFALGVSFSLRHAEQHPHKRGLR